MPKLLIMLLAIFVQAIDLIEEGRNIIIQRDVEHILIKLNVNRALKAIGRINLQMNTAKRSLAGNTLHSENKATLKPFFKLLELLQRGTNYGKQI